MSSTSPETAVRLRSIHVSPGTDTGLPEGPLENSMPKPAKKSKAGGLFHCSSKGGGHCSIGGRAVRDVNDDVKDIKNPLILPASTHTLLFTESADTLPFWFAVAVAATSFLCLSLAFTNNLLSATGSVRWNIPVNVSTSVRIAQFISIFIALLMEEEIPTGLYLLREIQKPVFRAKFPELHYRKFVASALLRVANGYFFLLNVFVILIQARDVIEIFYDVLALQFVQQLDDIAFSLSKIDVLGRRMLRACSAPVFEAEFERGRSSCSKMKAFLKVLYFINLDVLVVGMIVVSYRQMTGYYQCQQLSAEFGDDVWDGAVTLNQDTGVYESWTLVFFYFAGVYEKSGTHAGRPIYVEQRKFDHLSYSQVEPAEFRYCEPISAWVFTHKHIKKSNNTKDDGSGCNWLLRSPETDSFDLLEVGSQWSVWIGSIATTTVSTECDFCSSDVDCNLNGNCIDGLCDCHDEYGAQFLGTHCQTKVLDSCRTIVGEGFNETFSINYYPKSLQFDGPASTFDTIFSLYSRPVYRYIGGGAEEHDIDPTTEFLFLMYTGSRWFGVQYDLLQPPLSWSRKHPGQNMTMSDLFESNYEFHAFWNQAYSEITLYVSDPTSKPTPVGIDWYMIGERGQQFGPFGALYSAQLHNQTGRGYFRCEEYIEPTNSFIESYLPPGRRDRNLEPRQKQKKQHLKGISVRS